MSYNTYDQYKDSNIDWIGLIPSSWKLIRLKFLADIITGSTPSKNDDTYYKDGSFPWVKPDDLRGLKPITTTNILINNEGKRVSRIIPEDSILVCCIGSLGKIGIAGTKLATNQQINSLIPNKLLNNNYCKYMVIASSSEYNKYANSNVVDIINKQQQGELTYPIPSLEEQQQIANYLDKKTAKIDATITKNKELIQLLEEKRVALINQVVTKGLNPDVSMKDSGIEWIGEIPEHWEVVPFKRLFNNIKDGTHDSFQRVTEGKPLLSAKNVFNDTINISENESLISEEDYHSIIANGFPKKHDLLLTIVGTIGRSCVYEKDYPIAFQRSVSFIRLTQDNPYFYNYFVKSNLFYSQLMIIAKESAQKGVYLNDIKECLVIKPPIKTQNEIFDYLHEHITKINKTITKIKENITLLEEYKTSLIHHVVTGKIDVRGEEI